MLSGKSENPAQELNHLRPSLVGRFRIVARAFVAHKRMLGFIQTDRELCSAGCKCCLDLLSTFFWNVRVRGAEDHQQVTLDFACSPERSRVLVLSKFTVVNSGSVETDRRFHFRTERGAKREMSADAESSRAQLALFDKGMAAQILERGSAVRQTRRRRSWQHRSTRACGLRRQTESRRRAILSGDRSPALPRQSHSRQVAPLTEPSDR